MGLCKGRMLQFLENMNELTVKRGTINSGRVKIWVFLAWLVAHGHMHACTET